MSVIAKSIEGLKSNSKYNVEIALKNGNNISLFMKGECKTLDKLKR
jgi:hypothetical protein